MIEFGTELQAVVFWNEVCCSCGREMSDSGKAAMLSWAEPHR